MKFAVGRLDDVLLAIEADSQRVAMPVRHDSGVTWRGSRRRWLLAGLPFLVGLAALTWWLLARGEKGAAEANVLALPIAIVSMFLAAVAAVPRDALALAGSDYDAMLRELASSVRRERRLFLDQALGVVHDTRPAPLSLAVPRQGALPEPMESMLLRWQAMDGRRVGTLDTMARFFSELETGRLDE